MHKKIDVREPNVNYSNYQYNKNASQENEEIIRNQISNTNKSFSKSKNKKINNNPNYSFNSNQNQRSEMTMKVKK